MPAVRRHGRAVVSYDVGRMGSRRFRRRGPPRYKAAAPFVKNKMRIMADVNMPERAVTMLRDDGHDVLWVKDERPRAPDPNVLAWATQEEWLLITFDKDFGELSQRYGFQAPYGIILFRVPYEIPTNERAELITRNVNAQVEWPGYLWVINIRKRRALG